MLTDKKFMIWIHEHLEAVHGENPNFDYMHRLRGIIVEMDENKITKNTCVKEFDKSK